MQVNNLISDLENAIATRSDETGAMLHQITDFFFLNAGHYSPDQLDIYDGLLKSLIAKVDVTARATLAQRLAPIDLAPVSACDRWRLTMRSKSQSRCSPNPTRSTTPLLPIASPTMGKSICWPSPRASAQ